MPDEGPQNAEVTVNVVNSNSDDRGESQFHP